jgi:hypothetical protein
MINLIKIKKIQPQLHQFVVAPVFGSGAPAGCYLVLLISQALLLHEERQHLKK